MLSMGEHWHNLNAAQVLRSSHLSEKALCDSGSRLHTLSPAQPACLHQHCKQARTLQTAAHMCPCAAGGGRGQHRDQAAARLHPQERRWPAPVWQERGLPRTGSGVHPHACAATCSAELLIIKQSERSCQTSQCDMIVQAAAQPGLCVRLSGRILQCNGAEYVFQAHGSCSAA